MQGHTIPVSVSMKNSVDDVLLLIVKAKLESAYWSNTQEGVFSFQFLIGDNPITNTNYPVYFQLVRYTPDIHHNAFQTTILGRINNNGSIEYGGGRLGMLLSKMIVWNDGKVWNEVVNVPRATTDTLNLGYIKDQAKLDTNVIEDIYKQNYLY